MLSRFKEIWEQLKDTVLARWEQFQETDTYVNLKEKYDNLSPAGQKLVLALSSLLAVLLIFATPWSWYSVSKENLASFEETKNTINELLEAAQESKNLPPQSQPIPSDALKTKIDTILSEKGLTREQILAVSERKFDNPKGSTLIPSSVNQNGYEVALKKLNIKQFVDIGYEFDRISPTVKVLGVDIKATQEDAHYYDVNFMISAFSVDEKKEGADQKRGTRR